MHKEHLKKKILFVSVALALVMMLSLPMALGATPKHGGILKIIFFTTPRPNFGYNTELGRMNVPLAQHALETLTRVSDAGVVSPWLATAWKVAPDKKSVTIHLRKGVKFHDGSDFNAEALVWNIDRVIANKGSYHLEWKSGEAIDNYTVKLNLKNYSNRLPLSMARIIITSPTAYKTKGEKWANDHPIGTGPFKFSEYKKDKLLRYERNPDYWQKGLPYLDGIEYSFIRDPMTRKAAFENGEAHIVYEMKNDLRLDLEAKGYLTPDLPAYGGELTVMYMDGNHSDSPFGNLKVRQAVSHAIDRNALCQARGFGFWIPVTQFAHPDAPYSVPDYPDPKEMYNVAKAKQLMAEAGYPKGFETTIYSGTGFDRDAAVFIQQFLAEIGIKAEIKFPDRGATGALQRDGYHNAILIMGMIGSPNYGNDMIFFLGPGRLHNGSMLYPEDYLKAINNSLASFDIDPALFMKVNQLALDYQIAVPLVISPPGAQPAWVPELHDMGLYKEFEWIFNSSEKAWLEKN